MGKEVLMLVEDLMVVNYSNNKEVENPGGGKLDIASGHCTTVVNRWWKGRTSRSDA